MAPARVAIISLSRLSSTRLWHESATVPTPHATTSLIRVGTPHILIDPALPRAALGARLNERPGMKPDDIDTIFLTNFRPAHRAAIGIFTKAKILIHEREQEAARHALENLIEQAPDEDIDRKHLE